MRKKYTRPFRPFSSFVFLFLSSFLSFHTTAQTSIGTTAAFSNEDSASLVTFNFQNTNSYPVMITDIAGVLTSFGNYSAELWYNSSPVSGAPGSITTANGWTMAGSNASVTGIANSTTTVTQPLLGGLSLIVPANSTYGLAIAAYGATGKGLRVDNAIAATTLGGGGCNIITGPNEGFAGYGAAPVTPAAAARGWIGRITFINGSNCTGTPAAPVISGPSGICSGSLFTLSATGYALGPGISYQWQYFNTVSSTWVDIGGATGTSYTATGGITTATQFRLRTNCASSATQSTSNVVTVNISSALPGGTYTIDNTLPSSSINFTSFTAAAAALSCGIGGPVVFNVNPASGPYTETVTFGKVSGTNAFNTIRLNGNGAILQSLTDVTNPVILNLRGTDYMTVDSLTIRSLSAANFAYCGGILLSDTTYHDSILHCYADLSSLSGNIGSTYGIGLSSAYYNTSGDSSAASYCYIGHNHILGSTGDAGPYYGILAGNGWYNGYNNDDTMNIIAYNEIENVRYCGIYCYGSKDLRILYNDIHRTHKQLTVFNNFIGIQVYDGNDSYLNNDDDGNTYIIGNRIHDPYGQGSNPISAVPFWGIYYINWNDYNNNNSQGRSVIANNAIYNINNAPGPVYGIGYQDDYFTGNNNSGDTVYICHNTVDLSGTSDSNIMSSIYGIYINNYYQQSNDNTIFAWNNMVTVTGGNGGTKYGFYYFDDATASDEINAQRNNIFVNSSQPGAQFYAYRNLTGYPTLASFQVAYPSQEIGSLTVNPQYLNPAAGDFTPTNIALMNNGLNLQDIVPLDINGKVRSASPTPGAFEAAADASVTALAGPLGTYCSSVREVKVVVTNNAQPVINTLQLHWMLNGVQQPVVNYTGSIPGVNNAPNNTATVTLGNGLFLPNIPVEIKVWSSLPNGQPDGFPANDTLIAISQSSSSIPVDLGPDEAICTGNTKTLDAGNAGASYTWDNNATTQYRTVSAAGTYYVRVTAANGCIGLDTFQLSLRPLPIVDLGPDREICLGETTTFDAGNPGATYLWDDGSTAQTRSVDTAGYYEVQVTDGFGCMNADDISVIMKDIPRVDGINATHADSGTYTFYPINPLYALSYTWNFGDGTPEAAGYFVQHTYTALGIYTVTLSLVGECTGLVIQNSRTVDVFSIRGGQGGTGIGNIYGPGDFGIAPNPARDQLTVFNHTGAKMKHLRVYNVLGQLILDQDADSTAQHRISTAAMANGIYTLRIETSGGYVIRKFEVMR